MPKAQDCVWAVHDADFKSPIGELAQIGALIAREAERLELHYGADMSALQINIAPAWAKRATWEYGYTRERPSFSHIQWRHL